MQQRLGAAVVRQRSLSGGTIEQCWLRAEPAWSTLCPLYPRKRTCAVQLGMSAMDQKRTHAAQQKRSLINHLVGTREHGRWNSEAQGVGGLKIDHQLELRRLLDWQISGLCALENFFNVAGGATRKRQPVRPVANQASRLR